MSQLLDLNCGNCGAPLQRYASKMRGQKQAFCNRECLGQWRSTQTGPKSPTFTGGAQIRQGRVLWLMPWHHRADSNGYVHRYVIVAELNLGRALTTEEVVHHEDEDPGNDHPDNLLVFPTQADHMRYHGLRRAREFRADIETAQEARRAGAN